MANDNYPTAYRTGSRKYQSVPRTGLSTPTRGAEGDRAAPVGWQRNPGGQSSVTIGLPGSAKLNNVSNPANDNAVRGHRPYRQPPDSWSRGAKIAARFGKRYISNASRILRWKTKLATELLRHPLEFKEDVSFNYGGGAPTTVCNPTQHGPIVGIVTWPVTLGCLETQLFTVPLRITSPTQGRAAVAIQQVGAFATVPYFQSELKFGPMTVAGTGLRDPRYAGWHSGPIKPVTFDPMIYPMALPIGHMMVNPNLMKTPFSVLHTRPKSKTIQTEATKTGSKVDLASGLRTSTQVNPLLGEKTGTAVAAVTVTLTNGAGAGKPPAISVVTEHIHRPPTAKMRESKARYGGAFARAAVAAFGAVTEVGDFAEALWDALPEKFKKQQMAKRHGKKPKLTDMIKQIYMQHRNLDVPQAITNVLLNQMQDAAIGTAGKALRDARAKADPTRFHGYGTGSAL